MPRVPVRLHFAASLRIVALDKDSCHVRMGDTEATHLCGYPGGPKQPGILVHVERRPAHVVRLEHARPQIMDKAQGGHDERRCAGKLLPSIGSGIVPVAKEGEGARVNANPPSEFSFRGQ